MRTAISWLHWSGETFDISTMIFKEPSDFPDFIFCTNDSTLSAVINGTELIECLIQDNEDSSQGSSTLSRH